MRRLKAHPWNVSRVALNMGTDADDRRKLPIKIKRVVLCIIRRERWWCVCGVMCMYHVWTLSPPIPISDLYLGVDYAKSDIANYEIKISKFLF